MENSLPFLGKPLDICRAQHAGRALSQSELQSAGVSILTPNNQESQNSRLVLAGKDLKDPLAHGRHTFQRPDGSKSHFSSPSLTLPALARCLRTALAAEKEAKFCIPFCLRGSRSSTSSWGKSLSPGWSGADVTASSCRADD